MVKRANGIVTHSMAIVRRHKEHCQMMEDFPTHSRFTLLMRDIMEVIALGTALQ